MPFVTLLFIALGAGFGWRSVADRSAPGPTRFAAFARSGFGWRSAPRGAPLRLRLARRAAAQGLAAVNTVFRVLRLSRCRVGFRVAVGVPVRGASAPFRVDRWHVVVCAFRTSAVSMSLLSVWLHSPSGGVGAGARWWTPIPVLRR